MTFVMCLALDCGSGVTLGMRLKKDAPQYKTVDHNLTNTVIEY